jgi:uncharacterized membrane protein
VTDERDQANAMIHLYRGELGRMTTYRTRLDTTTNWALGANAAIVSYGYGRDGVPHYVFLVGVLVLLVFAWTESRRYQDFELIRCRVRDLERGFFAPLLSSEPVEAWRDALARSLSNPQPPITQLQALSVRLRRNYLWLLLVIWGAWLARLGLGSEPLLEAAAVGVIPGFVVIGVSALIVLPWIWVASYYRAGERS